MVVCVSVCLCVCVSVFLCAPCESICCLLSVLCVSLRIMARTKMRIDKRALLTGNPMTSTDRQAEDLAKAYRFKPSPSPSRRHLTINQHMYVLCLAASRALPAFQERTISIRRSHLSAESISSAFHRCMHARTRQQLLPCCRVQRQPSSRFLCGNKGNSVQAVTCYGLGTAVHDQAQNSCQLHSRGRKLAHTLRFAKRQGRWMADGARDGLRACFNCMCVWRRAGAADTALHHTGSRGTDLALRADELEPGLLCLALAALCVLHLGLGLLLLSDTTWGGRESTTHRSVFWNLSRQIPQWEATWASRHRVKANTPEPAPWPCHEPSWSPLVERELATKRFVSVCLVW